MTRFPISSRLQAITPPHVAVCKGIIRSVGFCAILVPIQLLERSAERCGKVTEFVKLRTADEVNGSLSTDPSLGVISQSFLQCGFTQKSLAGVISQYFYFYTSFTTENGEEVFLEPKCSLLTAVHHCEWGGKREEISLLVGLVPAQSLDLPLCSGKQIAS